MWRIIQGIPRVLRGQFHGSVTTQAPQAITRDEEQTVAGVSPRQPSRDLSVSTNHRVLHRTEWFNQRSKRDHHEDRGRGDADTEWGEWIHSFTHSQSTIDAIRCGTALLLSLQLTQVINNKQRDPNRCLARRLHLLAVPQTCSGVLDTHVMPPRQHDAQKRVENIEQSEEHHQTTSDGTTSSTEFKTDVLIPAILKPEASAVDSAQTDLTEESEVDSVLHDLSQDSHDLDAKLHDLSGKSNDLFDQPAELCDLPHDISAEPHIHAEPHDLCEESNDLCQKSTDLHKETLAFTERSFELCDKSDNLPETSHDLSEKSHDLSRSHNPPLSQDSAEPHAESHDFCKNWQNLSELYNNMRYNCVGTSLAKKGDYRGAVLLWHRASRQGYEKSQYNLAVCYETGRGVKKNPSKALELYTSAARGGHAKSMYNLALIYLEGYGVTSETHTQQAMDLLNQAAELGLAKAQVDLGVLYTQKTREDWLRASELFEMAANQKSVLGQFYLGVCYEEGWGVQRDTDRAAALYRQAAAAGHAPSQDSLASLTGHKVNTKPVVHRRQKKKDHTKKTNIDSSLSSSSFSSLGSHLDFTISDFSDSLLSTGSRTSIKPKKKSKRQQFTVNFDNSSDSDVSWGSDSGQELTGGSLVAGGESREHSAVACT